MTHDTDELTGAIGTILHDYIRDSFRMGDGVSSLDEATGRIVTAIAARQQPPSVATTEDPRIAALRDLVEGDAYELGSATWWDEYHEIMHGSAGVTKPPVAITEAMVEAGARALWGHMDVHAWGVEWDELPDDAPVKAIERDRTRACLTAALGDAGGEQ